jgi:type IV pilus assembly protein PilB
MSDLSEMTVSTGYVSGPTDGVRERIGDALVAMGVLTPEDVTLALQRQQSTPNTRLGAVLLGLGLATETDVARALGRVHGVPSVDPALLAIDVETARLLPRHVAERLGVLVRRQYRSVLEVVVADPVDVVALDDVRAIIGTQSISVSVSTRTAILEALERVWADQENDELIRAFTDETAINESIQLEKDEDAVTIRLVDRMLAMAVAQRASDIHIAPHRTGVTVRLRIDGVLRDVLELPSTGAAAVAARLKIISDLDVIERRLPQDGRTRIRLGPGTVLDARVSTLPTMHGENIVIRLLPSSSRLPNLTDLGLTTEQRASLLTAVTKPQGLVLITGPTGSGKTNTLYGALAEGVNRSRNVITLEDPVEIELPGAAQVQVDDRIGLTFAAGLRSTLRQDPDVVLVGEIRDQETAELAVRASLTGHLVLSTLHTLDAASALTRLTDMGVAPYLVTSALELVVSQRLVRTPCAECSVPDTEAVTALDMLGAHSTSGDWRRAVGCPACAETGYRGRTAVMELLVVRDRVKAALIAGANEASLRIAAHDDGMPTMLESALRLASTGGTTLQEVLRAVPSSTM